MTDNIAVLEGYSKQVWCNLRNAPEEDNYKSFPLLVRKSVNVSQPFWAWSQDYQEMCYINPTFYVVEDKEF